MGPGAVSIHEARSLPAKGKGSAGVGKGSPTNTNGSREVDEGAVGRN